MTLAELKTALTGTGLPVAYGAFKTAQTPPFISFSEAYANNFAADGVVYSNAHHVDVELYEDYRDETTEGKVEAALAAVFYEKSIEFLSDENIYQVVYELEV